MVADVSPVFKLHLFLGMTIFLVFPFTRLVHIWSVPVWYLGRRGYQIVRTSRPEQTARSSASSRRAATSASAPGVWPTEGR